MLLPHAQSQLQQSSSRGRLTARPNGDFEADTNCTHRRRQGGATGNDGLCLMLTPTAPDVKRLALPACFRNYPESRLKRRALTCAAHVKCVHKVCVRASSPSHVPPPFPSPQTLHEEPCSNYLLLFRFSTEHSQGSLHHRAIECRLFTTCIRQDQGLASSSFNTHCCAGLPGAQPQPQHTFCLSAPATSCSDHPSTSFPTQPLLFPPENCSLITITGLISMFFKVLWVMLDPLHVLLDMPG